MILQKDDMYKQFVFADVKNKADTSVTKDTHYMHIDKRNYYCKTTPFPTLKEDMFRTGNMNPEVIILTELFSSRFDYRKPEFELRWSTT